MMKVAEDNNLNIDKEALIEMVEVAYMEDDGKMAGQISRKKLREGLEQVPQIK